MQIPQQLLDSLSETKGFDKEAFEKVHTSGEQITSIRINPSKPPGQFPNFPPDAGGTLSKIPWSENGYYLNSRPSFTFDPSFHAGCYYVQDASSMFLEQALKQSADLTKDLKILDCCAAPGGKSTHIQSLITPNSLLVSNEVIRTRVNVLKDNIIKWGCDNVVVTTNDPKELARLENYFDVIVVDAPCSGSGLFRRDADAIEEWSESNVQLCSQRQQRILADIWPALKKNGILIYATCSYSKEEDEEIVDWLLKEFGLDHLPLTIDPSWGIVDTGKGYRFWPDKVKGEGFFLSTFRKTDGDDEQPSPRVKNKIERLTKKELELLGNWVKTDERTFVKNNDTIYAWRKKQEINIDLLRDQLQLVYSGVQVGEIIRDKLIPDHSLALSTIISDAIPRIQVNDDIAIAYLQKKDIQLEKGVIGWNLLTNFNGSTLGWVNILPNRVNNYYPKSLRILKER